MRRFVITGAPGSGKTSIVHALRDRGYSVVSEAATEVISVEQSQGNEQPWNEPVFIQKIIQLQRSRQLQAVAPGIQVQIYDRSPVCTLALAKYLGHPAPESLAEEIERIIRGQVYDRRVFFVRPIGFSEPTAARRISYQQSLEFERYHEDEYARLGFELVGIPAGEIEVRAASVDAYIRAWM
jgi:predicted ATPase